MIEAGSRLDTLARAATVHLLPAGADGPEQWGSGFFVAPGVVVTAAHVLRPWLAKRPDLEFAVRGDAFHDGIPVAARMESWLVRDSALESVPADQDLALVRLLDPEVEHECLWLVDRAVEYTGPLRVYGYRPDTPQSGKRIVPWSVDAEINVVDGARGLRFKPDAEFPPGVSGGPLVDADTGAVVGVVKSRRTQKDGGAAVSALALREFGPLYRELVEAHDRWHGSLPASPDTGDNWIDLQVSELGPDPLWTPLDRRKALDLLARIPAPSDAHAVRKLALVARSGSRWPGDDPALCSWRDGHGLLYEGRRPLSPLTFLRYLTLVGAYASVRGADTTILDAWVKERLRAHPDRSLHALVTDARLPDDLRPAPDEPLRAGVPYPEPGDGRTVVTVVLDPVIGAVPTRFFWQIWVDDGTGEPLLAAADSSAEGRPPQELAQVLGVPLARVFRNGDREGRPAPLEVALPVEEFDTEVHRWRFATVAALDDHQYLGAQRQVVLRDLARRLEPDNEAWTARWRGLRQADALTAHRAPEHGRTPQAARYAKLPATHVPVLCRPVGRGLGKQTMTAILDGGHPVVLWHIDGHTARGCGEACDELHQHAARLLDRVGSVAELPDSVRLVREEIGSHRADRRWAEPLALLYDDPDRPVPGGDLDVVDAPQ
ncbi:trypsin-like peptidase domain-containing protein [Streptomyces sp. HUAS MG91]|uniref:Trypsin-like peptidase domain-containing protein n=1 Tax=Streptomyces tabacisoli TaxID=3156398 RepID=A0AAU8IY75_9ACTN